MKNQNVNFKRKTLNTVFQENTRDEEQNKTKKKESKKRGVKNKGKRVSQHLSMLVKGVCMCGPAKTLPENISEKITYEKKGSIFKDGDRDLSFKVNDFLES